MTVHFQLLLPALLLLWTPRAFLRFGKTIFDERKRRVVDDDPRNMRTPGDISVRFMEEIYKPRNYLDLLRALAGGFLLVGTPAWDPAIVLNQRIPVAGTMPVHVNPLAAKEVMVLQLGILFVGVVLQTLRYDGRRMFFPPIFYVTGLAIVIAGVKPALFALILAWIVNRELKRPPFFFAALAVFLGAFGFVFYGRNLMVLATCALILVPAVMSTLFRRPLMAVSRKLPPSSR